GRVLDHADKAGAKVVLLGDDKQLPAIEAGAGFRAITERRGAAEITEIRRQRESWAKEASGEFARGDVRTALDAYNEHGGVRMVDTREDAKAAIAADY
ncbi:AAA family ATPase, partial [Xanthomonas citri pv. citri]|nr:AAA family ATPase [Xanthomonas citri pv. citri]